MAGAETIPRSAIDQKKRPDMSGRAVNNRYLSGEHFIGDYGDCPKHNRNHAHEQIALVTTDDAVHPARCNHQPTNNNHPGPSY